MRYDVTVRDGDDIWWDHRDWGALIDTPALIGALKSGQPAGH